MGIWLWILTAIIVVMIIIICVFKGRNGSRGRRGRRGRNGNNGSNGTTGSTGAIGPTGSTPSTDVVTGQAFIAFIATDDQAAANSQNQGTIITYGTDALINLDEATINDRARFFAAVATHTGVFHHLVANIKMNGNNQTGVTGFVTLWKTDGCDTAFHATELSAGFPVPSGLFNEKLECMQDNIHQVTVAPPDRFFLLWTMLSPTGSFATYDGPAQASFLYSF